MALIGTWDETVPTDASNASTGDDAIRSFATQVATGLGEAFYWPGSSANPGSSNTSAGEPRPSNLRYYRSLDIAGGADVGFLGESIKDPNLLVGRNALWHAGPSGTTFLCGHSSMLEHFTNPGNAPFTARWLVQSGSSSVNVGSGEPQNTLTAAFTFVTAYNGRPFILVEVDSNAGGAQYVCGFTSATGAGFTSVFSRLLAAGATPITVRYLSIGTVTLP